MKSYNVSVRSVAILLFVVTTVTATRTIQAQSTRIVYLTGDSIPGGTETFTSSASPTGFNDEGDVIFQSWTSGGYLGLFLSDASTGSLKQVVSGEHPSMNGELYFSRFANLTLNNRGEIAFVAITESTDGADNTRFDTLYWLDSSHSSLLPLAQGGDSLPGSDVESYVKGSLGVNGLSNAGRLSFGTIVESPQPDPFPGSRMEPAIYQYDGATGELTTVIRHGDVGPDGPFVFTDYITSSNVNKSGQRAFFAYIWSTFPWSDSGVYLTTSEPADSAKIVGRFDQAPDDNGDFSRLWPSRIKLNDSGLVGFSSPLSDTSGGVADDFGFFVGDGQQLAQVAREGYLTPDGKNIFADLGTFDLGNSGEFVFSSELIDASSGLPVGSAIFSYDSVSGELVELVRNEELGADHAGLNLAVKSINDVGQILFTSEFTTSTNPAAKAIYVLDKELGILPVATIGDPFSDSTISRIFGPQLNNAGQVVYNFSIQNVQSGIAVWSVPEPASYALCGLGAMVLLTWRTAKARYAG